ncbi:hypothetical protein PF005_g20782 [Phytophthora fragariae]|uniref:RxLR effector protein n=1 Tax=Phytophthora fragariae TaxID=53985 RepID=A0A6A3S548_9STRA|nr:hypothetical protein PF003_g39717 [Phytophthora fragariae]KAE8935585.1 hypothetical protein PF009_g14473 [Phytophthora fragariae]KAE8985210.1 hypothetical protein PF011_g20478 [Phytophthora fragariae]KAE9083636.1 hypothetical protein PF007_g21821 [Phytophthora fragariae]KAE9083961.1 hypothetical protein PF010_g21023 [Phytophthora fragariae]
MTGGVVDWIKLLALTLWTVGSIPAADKKSPRAGGDQDPQRGTSLVAQAVRASRH